MKLWKNMFVVKLGVVFVPDIEKEEKESRLSEKHKEVMALNFFYLFWGPIDTQNYEMNS